MVMILPPAPGFGQKFGEALGSGLGSGAANVSDFAKQLAFEKYKRDIRAEMFNKIYGQPQQKTVERQEAESIPEYESEFTRKPAESSEYFARAQKLALAGEKDLAQQELEQAKFIREQEELPKKSYTKSAYKSQEKFLEGIKETENRLPTGDISIKLIEEAVDDPTSKGKWNAFKDFLAEKTGFEGFRSAKGVELQSAVKQYFLGDLASIKGGRPNQLIEKQLLDAYPRVGRDPISNQKIVVGMRMQQDIARAKVEKTRELEEKFLSKNGYLPTGFEHIVNKSLRPEVEKYEKQALKQLESLSKFQNEYEKVAYKSLKKGEILMMDPEGGFIAVDKSKIDDAKSQGYIKIK